jgi:hypothetical protein
MKHFASLQEIDLAQLLENKKLHLKSWSLFDSFCSSRCYTTEPCS